MDSGPDLLEARRNVKIDLDVDRRSSNAMTGRLRNVLTRARRSVAAVAYQHVAEAAVLRSTRAHLVSAPHVKLVHLGRLDASLAAHLDGIAVAGDYGAQLATAALETPGVGEVFVAAVRGIDDENSTVLDKIIALVEALPSAHSGLISAFGWVSALTLKGTASALLSAGEPFRSRVGIAACELQRVDAAAALDAAIASSDVLLRARALRCAGEVGRRDLLRTCTEHLNDEDPECRLRAAQSAVLLGERGSALGMLVQIAERPGMLRNQALALALFASNTTSSRGLLRQVAASGEELRILIRGVGFAGDAIFIPWLIDQMTDDAFARLAGESFAMITGLDLGYLDLDRRPPEKGEAGPTDIPEDNNVAMDDDEGLPWPDQDLVQRWWRANGARFPQGVRTFMGGPVTRENCIRVLKEGFQRQRIAAAEHMCLLNPGTKLFNCAAPAWRQRRLLGQLT